MHHEVQRVDITNLPDLLRLAEEVRSTGSPRVLKRGEEAVAMLTPVAATPPDPALRLLAHRLAGSLADVDIPGWESSKAAEHWVDQLRQADIFPFEPPKRP
jgi:hypothetical protein